MDTVVDVLGTPISEGDTVAFATTSYKTAHLRIGTVADLPEGLVHIRYTVGGMNRGTKKRGREVVVIKGVEE